MKKLLSVALALLLLIAFPCEAFAEQDYSAMTDEELNVELNLIRAEITKRLYLSEAKEILIDNIDGITVTLKGEPTLKQSSSGNTLEFAIVVNSSDKAVGLAIDDCYINGWKESTLFAKTLDPGTKLKDTISFYHVEEDADLEDLADLEDVKMYFHTYEPETYHTLTKDISVIISF